MLDLAHVNEKKVVETFKMAVCSEEPFISIELLLSLSVAEILQPMSCLLEEFLKSAVNDYCSLEDMSDLSHEDDALYFVECVLKRIQEGFGRGVTFETNSSLWKDLQRLCANMRLMPTFRLQALKLIQEHYLHEQCDDKNTEELEKTLLLYETQAIVAKSWPEMEVKLSDLELEDSRLKLFDKLLKISSEWSQALCLTAILERWPKNQSLRMEEVNPWVSILKNIKRFEGYQDDDIYSFLELLFGDEILNDHDISDAITEIESWNEYPILVHSLLLLNGKEFHDKAINIILNNSQVAELKLRRSTLSLIIKKKLATQIVGSKTFDDCVQQILDFREENIPLIMELIEELKTSGKEIEAGMLSLRAKYVPKSLQVFSFALSVIPKH
ncbi:hypothetical protein J437_LFUL010402 [Ladona fulva]|uniref:Uncharacterized protein n=1 Tax=Ladona fulva TaxID=123851 RepID=A0A8K0P1K6_LADFU|nr:hypothetical protein J437_LFUL010402 [Ladona fulva]